MKGIAHGHASFIAPRLSYSCDRVGLYRVSMRLSSENSARFIDWCDGANVQVQDDCGVLIVYMDGYTKFRFDKWVKGL